MLVNLRVDMTIGNNDVLPTIVVEIEKLHSEAQKRNADQAELGWPRNIGELSLPVVVVQVVCIVGEVRFDDLRQAITIKIGGINPHTGLRAPIGAEGDARHHPDLLESAVTIVVVEEAWGRVVRDVEIEAAIAVEVQPDNAQAVFRFRINAQLLGDVGECAVAIVAIESVARAFQSSRATRDRDAAVLAIWSTSENGQVFQININVVRYVQVEIAVAIVVAKSRAGSPASIVAGACLRGSFTANAAVVVIKNAAIEIRYVNVFPAVIIVIAYRNAESPAAVREMRFCSHVREGAVVVVAIQFAGMTLAGGHVLNT